MYDDRAWYLRVQPEHIAKMAVVAFLMFLALLGGWALTGDLRRGERVVLTCGTDGVCELHRAGSIGSYRTIGRFPETGVVASTAGCRTERRTRTLDEGLPKETYYVEACQPVLWIAGWEAEERLVRPDLEPDAVRQRSPPDGDVPGGAVPVALTARHHDNLTVNFYYRIDLLRLGQTPWTLEFSTETWLTFSQQLAITVLYGLAVLAVATTAMVVAVRRQRRQR